MKFIANLLVAIHNVAAAEALVLAMKAGLDLLGFPAGDPRPPLLPLDQQGRSELQRLLTTG